MWQRRMRDLGQNESANGGSGVARQTARGRRGGGLSPNVAGRSPGGQLGTIQNLLRLEFFPHPDAAGASGDASSDGAMSTVRSGGAAILRQLFAGPTATPDQELRELRLNMEAGGAGDLE